MSKEWPQWLRDANTKNADVRIENDGGVIWYGGEWRGGIWYGGEWRGGVWCDGIWCDGHWNDGIWRDGIWCDGHWHGGAWYGGVWCDGHCAANRAMYPITGDSEGAYIGCEYRIWEEWDNILSGKMPVPEGAPPRDSEAWNLLVAAYSAQKEYQRVLKAAGSGGETDADR